MTSEIDVPVLIVDDNVAKRLALKAILAPLGHRIVEAGSGREALRAVMAQDFAVILMDVVMPGMDGFETAGLIRQRQRSLMTPIIFITAHSPDEIVKPNRYAEGAVDFIFAPIPPIELRAKVSVFASLFMRAEELAARAREVQASADQLRLLTDAAPVGIFQTDSENRYVYTNPRWSELTGVAADAAAGRPWDTIIADDQRDGLATALPDAGGDPAELSHRFELRPVRAHRRIVLLTSRAIPGPDGTTGWVGTLADVTAEAGAEAAMSAAKDKATEASHLKSDFLANMSHEIRTPMNGVIGMADLLLETPLDARQADYAQTVRNSGEALLGIIDDILDISKIEAGQLDVEEIDFDVRATVEAVVDLLAGSAQSKGLEVVVAIESAVPDVVTGDPGRVRQVLINLIGNAIKFTKAGEIVVRVTTADFGDTAAVLRFEVSDTGDGMGPDKLALIFEPFVQGDSSTSRQYGGTGLGLAISRQLVEMMGGRLDASSEQGSGSAFWFTITVRADPSEAPCELRTSDADLAGVAALIVDDNATQCGVLSEYLTVWGMSAETAGTAQAALAAMRAAVAEDRPFAAVVLDRSISTVNGLALEHEILADSALTARIVLMADLGHERELSPGPDFDACPCISKPIHLKDLRAALRVAIGLDDAVASSGQSAIALPSQSVDRSPGHLLLAEDNLVNQKVALAMLTSAGYRVDTVLNGAEAVDAVAQHHYDAILMDCQMPVLNGYEATAAIRAHQAFGPQTPIIALTAGARPEDRARCMEAGMDGYLAKPVSKDALLGTVRSYVSASLRASDFLDEASEVLDEAVVSDLEALDGEVLTDLVPLYLDEAASHMTDMSVAINRGDTLIVGRAAHKLKGSSCTIGAARVSRIASEVETAVTVGDLAAAGSLVDQLSTDLDGTRQAFQTRMG
jgi:PAS domain S-box-containing protein